MTDFRTSVSITTTNEQSLVCKAADLLITYLSESRAGPSLQDSLSKPASTNTHSLPQVENTDLPFILQDGTNGPDGTHTILRPVFCHIVDYSFYRFQMTLDNRSIFRKSIVHVFQPSSHYFLLLPRPPSRKHPESISEDVVKVSERNGQEARRF